jgi:hypothetical protein
MLDPLKESLSPEEDEDGNPDGSVFATKKEEEGGKGAALESGMPDTFEDLPIEIRSLTERYKQPTNIKVPYLLTTRQVSRIALRKSPSQSPLRRRAFRSLSRLLYKSLVTHQHTYSHTIFENRTNRVWRHIGEKTSIAKRKR